MKPRTLARLALMVEAASLKMREEILRHNTLLGQIEYQKGVLADYRARLAASWTRGGVTTAGQARNAEVFVAASVEAGGKIEAEAARTRLMLEDAVQVLSRHQQKRRALETAQRAALADEAREIERRVELAAGWRRKGDGVS